MSDAQVNEDTIDESGQDSPVIAELRKQLRDLQKERKEDLKKLEVFAAEKAQARSAQAKQFVDAAGFPNLSTEIVLERIEGDVTAESVVAALNSIGLSPQAEASQEAQPAPEPNPTVPASEMGQRVAAAAQGSPVKDVMSRLNEATSQAEIAAIMEEAGLTHSYM